MISIGTWVLVIMLTYGTSESGVSVSTIEFNSKEACMEAAKKLADRRPLRDPYMHQPSRAPYAGTFTCVEK